MTLLISAIHPDVIVMSADSRRTEEGTRLVHTAIKSYIEFSTIRKHYIVDGIGCFSFWGDITLLQSRLPIFLMQLEQEQPKDISELNDHLSAFLRDDINPRDNGSDDIGFHVGGYDRGGNPKLYHTFWGFPAGADPNVTERDYHTGNHHQVSEIVYNGRNAYARAIINFLIQLGREVGLKTLPGQYDRVAAVRLNDYLIRYTEQFEEKVGDTISTSVILPGNRVLTIRNNTKRPLNTSRIAQRLNDFENSGELKDICYFRDEITELAVQPRVHPQIPTFNRATDSPFPNSRSQSKQYPGTASVMSNVFSSLSEDDE